MCWGGGGGLHHLTWWLMRPYGHTGILGLGNSPSVLGLGFGPVCPSTSAVCTLGQLYGMS